ncbi:MAG: FtsX-like permease family protein [Pseudomonadota bacterium]
MAEHADSSTALGQMGERSGRGGSLYFRIAWRNLWRNKRRTWLTAGGIAFAIFLVSLGMSFQVGSYASMINNATSMYLGQMQISHRDYVEDEKLENTLLGATELQRRLNATFDIAIAPRAQAFALVSVGERSFGGLTVGVDFAAEKQVVNFFRNVNQGELPSSADEVLIGATLARNLGAQLGDELVVLGTAKEGGVAALALTISGTFESGQAELDRTLLFTALETVQNGFELGDELHQFVIRVKDLDRLAQVKAALQSSDILGDGLVVRTWPEYLPELVQSIELDRISAQLMYGVILILVTFSVVNTFLMVVFERTREFGMLLAVGMRPTAIMSQVLIEAALMWLIGVLIGLSLTVGIVGYYAQVGLSIAGMEELSAQFYMDPRIYPGLSADIFLLAPLVLLVGTQFAALFATVRVRRLDPVVALRAN